MEFHNPDLALNGRTCQNQFGVLTPHIDHAKLAIMTYPNRIKELRESMGLSQAALGELANTSQSQIDRLEKGGRGLGQNWIDKFTKIFNCSADYLLRKDKNQGGTASKPDAVFAELKTDKVNKKYNDETVWNVASYLAPKLGFSSEQDRKEFADLFISLCDYLEEPSTSESGPISAMSNVVDFAFRTMRRSAS
jgi:transcriptional regulator with XRE-family HTH domain